MHFDREEGRADPGREVRLVENIHWGVTNHYAPYKGLVQCGGKVVRYFQISCLRSVFSVQIIPYYGVEASFLWLSPPA